MDTNNAQTLPGETIELAPLVGAQTVANSEAFTSVGSFEEIKDRLKDAPPPRRPYRIKPLEEPR